MSTELDRVDLTLAEAVELAAGLVATTAATLGIDALIVKGRFATEQGLRATRAAVDVDVLVRPGDAPALADALGARGWRARPEDPDDAIFPVHSRSFFHPGWPCDVDVHTRFPGFEAPADATFTAIWATRERAAAAGASIWIPGPPATLLIVALHGLRTPAKLNERADLAQLANSAAEIVDGPDVLALAEQTGALGAVEPFLRRAYPGLVQAVVPAPSAEWILRSRAPDSATVRLITLRHAAWRRRPGLLVRALRPSRDALAAVNLDALGTDDAGLRQLRRRRRLAALRRVPSILREYRAYQRDLRRYQRGDRS